MKWICNLLLNIIVTIWSLWVFAFRRADFNAPYFKWFMKCWDAKDRSGGIVWNEFLATMKYLCLHYINRHKDAEMYLKYTDYVDMTPFAYGNRGRYSEDNWDMLISKIYGLNYNETEQSPKINNDIPLHQTNDTHEYQEEVITESKKEWWQEEYKPYTAFEKHEKQMDENALEESIDSMIKAHIKRFQEEEGKTIKSILKPKSYPNANIQLFSDANRQSVLKVVINESGEDEKELYERLKNNKFFKMFVKEDFDTNEESLILDFHNDEEQAKNTILDILTSVYNQPKDCAINYITNVSGYTMQEQGIENSEKSSGCGCWIWILLVLLIAGGAGWYYFMNDSSTEAVGENVEASDSIATSSVVDENTPTSALAFLDQFYKNEIEKDDLRNYVTANVINKLRSDYDYDCPSNDCLATWVFTAYPAGADLDLEKGPIITKTDTEGKFKVDFRYSGYNGSEKTYETRTVYLTVTEMGGKYLICDYEVADGETIEEKEGLLSFEDALKIAEEMQIKDGVVEGFRSPENVNKIMKEYGYERKGKYFVDRQMLFSLLYYKNCTLAESTGNDCYTDFPSANGGGDASFVGLDDTSLVIAPFSKAAFDGFMKQVKEKGATLVENDESTIVYKYSSIQITGYKRGVFSLNYCIFVSKEE